MNVWCVAWKDRETGRTEWCATKRGRVPDESATSDETRCNHYVTLRIGSEQREPTCPECRKRMRLEPREGGNDGG